MWDTAGLEQNRHCLTAQYYRDADAVVFVYDITDPQTFRNVTEVWLREWNQYQPSDMAVLALVGNKLDQESSRKVSTEEGLLLADREKMTFIELSTYEESSLVKLKDLMKTLAHEMMFCTEVGRPPPRASSGNISLGWELLDTPTEPIPREVYELQQSMAGRKRKECGHCS